MRLNIFLIRLKILLYKIKLFILIMTKRVVSMFYDNTENRRKVPTELYEIAEKIASGKPKISMDFICDWFIDLWNLEQLNKRDKELIKDEKKPKACRTRRISIQ